MKVLISGATGLIGSALTEDMCRDGHTVVPLTRQASVKGKSIQWDPRAGRIEAKELEGFDAVVHLAGENIGGGRWTSERKARIMNSRRQGTTLLMEALAQLEKPPQVVVSASAIGYYSDRGNEELTESNGPGEGFLSEVCVAWEQAAEPVRQRGIRVVHPRFGIVLSKDGGALSQMLTPFKLGAGGKFGSGRQWWSWVTLHDVIKAIRFSIDTRSLAGPVNVVAPSPVRNEEFARTLGSVIHRPAIFPVPAFALKVMLGEMARPLLLDSTRVVPLQLWNAGFSFAHSELAAALRHVLGKK